jgi:hypothetical protein
LAKEYSQMPSYERNADNAIAKQLTELSGRYLNDEKFNNAIAVCNEIQYCLFAQFNIAAFGGERMPIKSSFFPS